MPKYIKDNVKTIQPNWLAKFKSSTFVKFYETNSIEIDFYLW
jgi:hypothetical protein